YGNLPPREISMKDVFRSGDSSKKIKIAEGQWYRYAPSYVSPAYHLLEGFPFIQEPPSGDLQERVLIRHHDYDQCLDRKSGSAGMPRPISYAVFCLKKKKRYSTSRSTPEYQLGLTQHSIANSRVREIWPVRWYR